MSEPGTERSGPLVIDLYSGPGGVGYALAELPVEHIGVDIEDHSDTYPGTFIQADASDVEFIRTLPSPDLLWMSPPCQAYSSLSHVHHEDPKEAHPTFDDLNVRQVIDALDPEEYVIENVSGCDDLRNPTRINGFAVGYEFELERWFETSFPCPDAIASGESVLDMTCGIGNSYTELAELKDYPKAWGRDALRSAIPRGYVRHLLDYCPSSPAVSSPATTRQTQLATDGGSERCGTEGCYRDAEYLMTASTDEEGNILEDRFERPFCRPCKMAAEFTQAWHRADHTFRPLTPEAGGQRGVQNAE